MRIAFSGETALYRWAWTEGLEPLGQLDVTVPLPWQAGDARDAEVERLLSAVADAVGTRGQRFRQGDTFDFGWTTLRFEAGAATGDSAGRLVISELAEPLLATPPTYARGAALIAGLRRAQAEALTRNGIEGEPVCPHRSELAVICTRVPPAGPEYPRPLVLERLSAPEHSESGWVIRCADLAHDHDNPQALASVRLLHVVAGFAGIVPYLALPVGSAVLMEERDVIVFRPGEHAGSLDPAPRVPAETQLALREGGTALRWTL